MAALPPPEFVHIDPAAIEADLVRRYEEKSGKTLYPAQVERLFIDQVAYAKTLILTAIQHAGEQLLVRYSNGAILDYLGDLVSTPRLLAGAANTILRFTAPVATGTRIIPAGTRATTSDGKVAFATDQDVSIPAGSTQVSTSATCDTVGVAGNGWAVGQLNTLPAPPMSGLTVTNVTESADGADEEGDERYRERIILAPEAYTTAGSRGAYRYHALAAHQSILDVTVLGPDDPSGPTDGNVDVYVLLADGLPGASMLDTVKAKLSAEKVRPLCDTVNALAAVEVTWSIKAHLTFFASAERSTSLAAAQLAAEAYAANRRAGLGRDVVPEQLIAALQVNGVYRAALELPTLATVHAHEWANCVGIELIDAGVADG